MSCNHACQLFLDSTNKFDAASPVEPELAQIAIRHGPSNWRDYLMEPDPNSSSQYRSDWIELEEGEFYKIEGFLLEYDGSDHFTVSVEFEMEDSTGHHHANKEVQILEVRQAGMTQEKFRITVLGANGSKYQVQFVNPKHDPNNKHSQLIWKSGEIKDNYNIWQVRQQIVRYFSRIWGSDVSIELTYYDADDVEVESSADAVKRVYTVTVVRLIGESSFVQATILPASGATSEITVEAPFQSSTAAMTGSFYIACPNEDGSEFVTRDFGWNAWPPSIDLALQLDVPHAQLKTYVRDTGKYPYY